jgi:hypothetical protein
MRTCASSRGTAVWQSRRGRPILAEFLAAARSKNIFGILAQVSAMMGRVKRVTSNYREQLKRIPSVLALPWDQYQLSRLDD